MLKWCVQKINKWNKKEYKYTFTVSTEKYGQLL